MTRYNNNSAVGKMILPGDAHDAAWNYIHENAPKAIADAMFMLAPHHGRHSHRSYDFLRRAKPKLTLIECARSQYIGYDQWHRRELDFIT